MLKVIIAGSRKFRDYRLLESKLDKLLQNHKEIEIVSGMAQGADTLGVKYALKRNIPYKRFPANWNLHGRKAGYIRNSVMAKYGDVLVAFWDGSSLGTLNIIELFFKAQKPVRIVKIHDNDRQN